MQYYRTKKKGFSVTMDIEKALVSLNHYFSISALGKYGGFGENFIPWVKVLLRKQDLISSYKIKT